MLRHQTETLLGEVMVIDILLDLGWRGRGVRLLTRMSTRLPFRSTSVMESLLDRDMMMVCAEIDGVCCLDSEMETGVGGRGRRGTAFGEIITARREKHAANRLACSCLRR